jgi:hypothetical protein
MYMWHGRHSRERRLLAAREVLQYPMQSTADTGRLVDYLLLGDRLAKSFYSLGILLPVWAVRVQARLA